MRGILNLGVFLFVWVPSLAFAGSFEDRIPDYKANSVTVISPSIEVLRLGRTCAGATLNLLCVGFLHYLGPHSDPAQFIWSTGRSRCC